MADDGVVTVLVTVANKPERKVRYRVDRSTTDWSAFLQNCCFRVGITQPGGGRSG